MRRRPRANESRPQSRSEATRRGFDRRRAAGLQAGGEAPYGYKWSRPRKSQAWRRRADHWSRLVVDRHEQATIIRIARLHATGYSIRQIQAVLDVEGRQTRRGGRWRRNQVHRVLQRIDAGFYSPAFLGRQITGAPRS